MLPAPQLPEAFLIRMKSQVGDEFLTAYLESFAQGPYTSLRRNPAKIKGLALEGHLPIPWHPMGYYLEERPEFVFDPLFHAGAYYVQEASSMLLHQFVEPKEQQFLLDLCAAPGGKSTLLAQAMGEGSVLLANEVVRNRAGILAENITRWGNPHVWVTQMDPERFSGWEGCFDVIVVDAPCSGEGLFRKDPHSIQHWSEQAVETCAARQKRILAAIAPCLKPGGHLIYSTCTYSPLENEDNMEWLLDSFPGTWDLDPVRDLEAYGAMPIEIQGEKQAAWRCIPPMFKGEGFFICRMRKKGSSQEVPQQIFSQRKKKSSKKQGFSKEISAFLAQYVHPKYWDLCSLHGEYLCYFPPLDEWISPSSKMNVIQRGLRLGKIRRKELTPTHALSLSALLNPKLSSLSLTKDQALSYLRKNDLVGIHSEEGWQLVSYQGVNLGWIKVRGNKGKNQYPINWRIRKG